MYCKKCGKEIPEDSKFCNSCGATQEVETKEETTEKKESYGCGYAIVAFILFIVVVAILSSAALPKSSEYNINNIFDKITSKGKATSEDIEMDFYSIPSLFSSDTYYAVLQANEKIKDLVIEIEFYDNNGKLIATERINVGNVTPGNEYKFELNENGYNDIDDAKKMKTKVIEGYIVN